MSCPLRYLSRAGAETRLNSFPSDEIAPAPIAIIALPIFVLAERKAGRLPFETLPTM